MNAPTFLDRQPCELHILILSSNPHPPPIRFIMHVIQKENATCDQQIIQKRFLSCMMKMLKLNQVLSTTPSSLVV